MAKDEKRIERTEVTTETKKDRRGSPEEGESTEYTKVTTKTEAKKSKDKSTIIIDE
jgi:hypothetical protein